VLTAGRVTWRRLTPSDLAYGALVVGLTFLAARIWWLSEIVPGQDYPQFLVFVRAAQDYADPSSPFHCTYTLAPWFVPTALPIHLTRLLCVFCGGSIETAGKLLLTLQNLGMVASTAYLLRVLGRPRWAIVLLFPLIHSRWTVIGGFVSYATVLPLVVLGWALTVRWLQRRDLVSGVLLGGCLCVTLLWHGLGFAALGLGFGGLWLLWRAPSLRARATAVVPTLPSLALFAVWVGSTFQGKTAASPWRWRPLWESADHLVDHVWASVPHLATRTLLLALLLLGSLVLGSRNVGALGPSARIWRVGNPFLFVAGLYLVAFFVLPTDGLGVEILAPRLSIHAAMACIFAWNLPVSPVKRAAVVAAISAFAVWCLGDITDRFRAFDVDTRGASALMDQVGLHETLYHSPPQGGGSDLFAMPNRALVELEQFSTVRHGGLPNSSFAGYGMNYVRYVDGDPMPFLHGPPAWSADMKRFDYVLTRADQGPSDAHFQLLEQREGWRLYGVCGSRRFPACDAAGSR
jgi:hypothetical protein